MRRPLPAVLTLFALAALANGSGSGVQAAETAVVGFAFTGAPKTWVVPDGVTEITATACGSQGGCATSALAVTLGETLTIVVGGQGSATATSSVTPTVSASGESIPGYNGGARGGVAGTSASFADPQNCLLSAAAAAGRTAPDQEEATDTGTGGGTSGSVTTADRRPLRSAPWLIPSTWCRSSATAGRPSSRSRRRSGC